MRVRRLDGAEIASTLPRLAELRIEVFRAYPYLYDGALEYERDYLDQFAKARAATLVAAFDGANIVGCATASALSDQHAEFAAPLRAASYDLNNIYYFGESVLLPDYRGRGIGHAFFNHREAAARAHGFASACFCAVRRPEDHPLKPVDYSPLDPFWTARGYRKLEGLTAWFDWRDIDKPEPDEKPMDYWMREL